MPKATTPCYICGSMFTPDPERVREWAESGRHYDPTDWECPTCSTWWSAFEQVSLGEPLTPEAEAEWRVSQVENSCARELSGLYVRGKEEVILAIANLRLRLGLDGRKYNA